MKRLVAEYSQHFLRSPALIAELVGHSSLRRGDTVVDIGAGSGAITAVLARRVGRVIAYEQEPLAWAKLLDNMARFDNVEVLRADFMTASLPDTPYKVFANIPFHLSSEIIQRLAFADLPPRAVYVIVQRQFARKLVAGGDHFHSALGVAIAPWWTARIRRPLRRTDFTPPPAVDTVLFELKPRPEPLLAYDQRERYRSFVYACFADPRVYARAGGPSGVKPSQLAVDAWVQLYQRSVE